MAKRAYSDEAILLALLEPDSGETFVKSAGSTDQAADVLPVEVARPDQKWSMQYGSGYFEEPQCCAYGIVDEPPRSGGNNGVAHQKQNRSRCWSGSCKEFHEELQ